MLIGTAWMIRASVSTAYVPGVALPMIVFGIGQGPRAQHSDHGGHGRRRPAGRRRRRRPGQRRPPPRRALGIGSLVTVFAAAGSATDGSRQLLAERVLASLTVATVFLVLALVMTMTARPRARSAVADRGQDASLSTGGPGPDGPRPPRRLTKHCAPA